MKVAIIGAGIAGLSCAYKLKKEGIEAVVFEKNNCIGGIYDFTAMNFKVFNKKFFDAEKYCKQKYDIEIKPVSSINKMTLIGTNKKTSIKSDFGKIFLKGYQTQSIENQLASAGNICIEFNKYISNINELAKNFDYVVVASGNSKAAKELNIWNQKLNVFSRIATIVGNFETGHLIAWLNNRFAKNLNAYFIPVKPKKAYLILNVNNITSHELDFYWKEFLTSQEARYKIIETKDVSSCNGYVDQFNIGNIYLTGNAAGLNDSFLGFGFLNAIESGFAAAESIIYKKNYKELLMPILNNIKEIDKIRLTYNNLDNAKCDKYISFLNVPFLKSFMANSPISKKYLQLVLTHIANN